jgi:hypothetical protein
MKRNVISIIVILLTAIGMLSLSSCKRNKPGDPIVITTAGIRIAISGTANPSTLYIPETQPTVSSLISISVLHNDGSAATGYTIIFQIEGLEGYFEGFKLSDTRVTDASGRASITFFVPSTADITNTVVGNIRATLVDNGRLDNLSESDIFDLIPVRLIPYQDNGVEIEGHVYALDGSGIEGVLVLLEGTDDTVVSGTDVTGVNGRFKFLVPPGWHGTITPQRVGFTFDPESYTVSPSSPLTSNLNVNFYAFGEAGDTLAASISNWDALIAGDSTVVNTLNSTGVAFIPYSILPSDPWISTSKSEGTTPDSFTITVDPNTTGTDRTGSVTLTGKLYATNTHTIDINQNLTTDLGTLAADINLITVPFGGSVTTLNVYNSTTDDTIDFIVTPSDPFITVDKTSGSTDTTLTITLGQLPTSSARSGTVTLTSTTTGVDDVVTISINQTPDPFLIADKTTVSLSSAAGDTETVYISTSDGTTVTFNVGSSPTWITFDAGDDSGTTNSGDSFIRLKTEANATGSDRTGTITIISPTAAPVTITVTQAG